MKPMRDDDMVFSLTPYSYLGPGSDPAQQCGKADEMARMCLRTSQGVSGQIAAGDGFGLRRVREVVLRDCRSNLLAR